MNTDSQKDGTLTAAFNDSNYGDGWISSGHITSDGGTPEYNFEIMGTTEFSRADQDIDYAYIHEDRSDTTGIPKIADADNSGGTDYPVGGIVNDEALCNDVGGTNEYHTQGWATCRTSGTLMGTGGINGTSYVGSTQDSANGDSGGVLFDEGPSDFYAYIGGVVFAQINETATTSDHLEDSDDCQDDTKSTTAGTVENKQGGQFLTDT